MNDFLAFLERAPLTVAILFAYLTVAFLADPIQPEYGALIAYGGAISLLIADGEPWRLLSCAFVHGGLLHLLFNSMALLAVGPALEQRIGSLRFALVYLVGALSGSLAGIAVLPVFVPLVGGSAALFAMFGAEIARMMRGGRTLLDFTGTPQGRAVLTLVAINLGLGFMLPNVSNAGHLGGLLGGFVLAFCFLDRGRRDAPDVWTRVIQFSWIALLLTWTLHAAMPVTRYDWLQRQVQADQGTARSAALIEAFHRAGGGITLQEVLRMREEVEQERQRGLRPR